MKKSHRSVSKAKRMSNRHIKIEFCKLQNSKNLMKVLRHVTKNDIPDIELMKHAIKASSYGIDINSLPKLLEFTITAQKNGKSLESLMDSLTI